MNCSKCGYQLDAFDEICPKCRHNPKTPTVAQPAPISPSASAPSTPSVPAPVARPVVKFSLRCPVCGNEQVQKAAAIYDAGTTYSTSRSEGAGLSMGVGHIWGGGDFTTLGLSTSESRTSHSGSTQLASQLSPPYLGSLPPKPKPPEPHRAQGKGGDLFFPVATVCLLPLVVLRWGVFGDISWSWPWSWQRALLNLPLVLFVVCLIGAAYYTYDETQRIKAAGRKTEADLARWRRESPPLIEAWKSQCAQIRADWQSRMDNWKRLYYCFRCAHVYNVETDEAAPVDQMRSLL